MRGLLKLGVLLGLIAGLLFLVPFGGRTVFDRWRASRGVGDFTARTWAEMRGLQPPASSGPPAAPRKVKPGKPAAGAEPAAPDQPLDSTTDADRKALDQLLDRHLADPPAR